MRYKLTIQMDLSVIDDKYKDIVKHKRKKPIGDPISIEGTEEEILDKIHNKVYEMIDLASDIYVDGEENVTIPAP